MSIETPKLHTAPELARLPPWAFVGLVICAVVLVLVSLLNIIDSLDIQENVQLRLSYLAVLIGLILALAAVAWRSGPLWTYFAICLFAVLAVCTCHLVI